MGEVGVKLGAKPSATVWIPGEGRAAAGRLHRVADVLGMDLGEATREALVVVDQLIAELEYIHSSPALPSNRFIIGMGDPSPRTWHRQTGSQRRATLLTSSRLALGAACPLCRLRYNEVHYVFKIPAPCINFTLPSCPCAPFDHITNE
jgi:hypothetical protein